MQVPVNLGRLLPVMPLRSYYLFGSGLRSTFLSLCLAPHWNRLTIAPSH